MGLSRYEQETVVNFNAEESKASIYTADPVWIRKLLKNIEENPQEFDLAEEHYLKGERIGITVEFPKKLVQVRKGTVKLTEEQKAQRTAQLQKLRERNNDIS